MKKVLIGLAVAIIAAASFSSCKKNNSSDPTTGTTLSTGTPKLSLMFNYVAASIDLSLDTVKAKLKKAGFTEDGEAFVLTKNDVTYKIVLTKLAKDPTIVGGVNIAATGKAENFTSTLLYESATQMPFAKGFTFGPQESLVFKEMKYGKSEQDCTTQTDWSTLSNYASDVKGSEYVSLKWVGAISASEVKDDCTTSLEAKRVAENGGASFYLIATCDHCYE